VRAPGGHARARGRPTTAVALVRAESSRFQTQCRTSTPEGFVDGGDQIVVPVHVQARAKNGKTMDVHNVWIYGFSGGKLVRNRVYADAAVLRDRVEAVTPA
jgi:ketosteroid isomerase-like protein